jgi:uncharacterized membrane protein YuzA (DUF378 family)
MKHHHMIDTVSVILLLLGGITFGLIGIFGFNLLEIFGEAISRILYILIGISAVYRIVVWTQTKGK